MSRRRQIPAYNRTEVARQAVRRCKKRMDGERRVVSGEAAACALYEAEKWTDEYERGARDRLHREPACDIRKAAEPPTAIR